MLNASIWVGFDNREAAAFAVAKHTIRRHLTLPIPIYGLLLSDLVKAGLYTRPIEYRASAADRPIMWDVVSDAPQSTDHANARFFLPMLANPGWALFMDGDMLVRGNLAHMFQSLDQRYAVYCVHHKFDPAPGMKMDSQVQTSYGRKNWSSFLIFNTLHPANKALTLDVLNNTPGRDLHRLFWLADCDIGELDPKYNFLVGHSDPSIDPVVVHHTSGTPDMPGYENVAFADEWRDARDDWARGASRFEIAA